MNVIFISHSSHDNEKALCVRDWLVRDGWGRSQLFLDLEDLYAGDRWRQQLNVHGITCEAVILCLSDNWLRSHECVRELTFAEAAGKPVLPVVVRTLSERIPSFLSDFQFAHVEDSAISEAGFGVLRAALTKLRIGPRHFPWPPKGEPDRPIYPGLRALTEVDAAIFFGRDAAIANALAAIRRMKAGAPERLLVIVGASGSGKSSFLKAGILARLAKDKDSFAILHTMRPELDALEGPSGLGRSLGLGSSFTTDAVNAAMTRLRQQMTTSVARLRSTATDPDHTCVHPALILPIDQAEELFRPNTPRNANAIHVLKLALEADPGLIIVLAIRSDALPELQADQELNDIPRVLFELPRLPIGAFKEVIVGPAAVARPPREIAPALVDRLLSDLQQDDALPLLAFALQKLLLAADPEIEIGVDAYAERVGGLAGIVNGAADEAFQAMSSEPGISMSRAEFDKIVRRIFLPWLVVIGSDNASPMRRIATANEIPAGCEAVLVKLIEQRLLVVDCQENDTLIEVSHEAVFRHWRALKEWIQEDIEEIRTLNEIVQASQQWFRHSTRHSKAAANSWLTHNGARLSEAQQLMSRVALRKFIGPVGERYLMACVENEASQRIPEMRQNVLRLIAVCDQKIAERSMQLAAYAAVAAYRLAGAANIKDLSIVTDQTISTYFRTTDVVSYRNPVTDIVLSNDGCYVQASHTSRRGTWKLSTGEQVLPGEEEGLSLGAFQCIKSSLHDRDRIAELLNANRLNLHDWWILKNRQWLVGMSTTISLSLPNHLHPTSRAEFEELALTHKTISTQEVEIIDILSGDVLFRTTVRLRACSLDSNEREDSLAFVSESGDLTVWRLSDPEARHLGSLEGRPISCTFNTDGTWLLVCTSEACQFVDTNTGARQTYVTTPTSKVFLSPNDVWVLVSNQGMDFVTISSNGVVSGMGRVRSVSEWGTLESIIWSPAGTYVVCNYKGGIATYELLDENSPTEALIEYLRRRWSTGPSDTQLKTLEMSQFRW